MKLKQLQASLEGVAPFSSPDIQLEQYATSAHIAARMLYTVSACAASKLSVAGLLIQQLCRQTRATAT